jgi:ABC-type transport system involved in cytochrome bd biosynthesis fused ATPase/permease subunit
MARESETFRRATMRILRMQLGSIIFMDFIAFGGAAFGVVSAARALAAGRVDLSAALMIALLSAEFFIPLRQLGALFHVSMNGAAAAKRVFAILDLPSPPEGGATLPAGALDVEIRALCFAYGKERQALSDLTLCIPRTGLVALTGASGSGKSTVAAILSGARRAYAGSVRFGGTELRTVSQESLAARVALVPHDGFVFAGTVAENLRLAKPDASEAELTAALKSARLWDFLAENGGLDAAVSPRGANLSGGQRQRLCLARALLRESALYIFDEAASNIDVESEQAIMEAVYALAKTKAVLLISHRLESLANAGRIYLLAEGRLAESGAHADLVRRGGAYARLYAEQKALEAYGKGAAG